MAVEDLAWHRFEVQLGGDWIKWNDPRFLDGHEWPAFLTKQQSRYPGLPDDLADVLHGADEVWILQWKDGHSFTREFVFYPGHA